MTPDPVTPRLKVLFLTHRLPYAPNRGDRTRSFHILRVLAEHADVSVVSLVHDADEAAQAYRVQAMARRVLLAPVPRLVNRLKAIIALTSSRSMTEVLLESPALRPALRQLIADDPPDVILAYCSSMARFAMEPELRRFPLVIDMVDADSAKWRAFAANRRWPASWIYRRESRALAVVEAQTMRHAHATVAVNAREVEHLRTLVPEARIEAVGVGVDLAGFSPPDPPASRPRVVFTGVMNYKPNEDGAIWITQVVWPWVRKSLPNAELRIVGASPSRRVRGLHDASQGVVVTGTVADVRPELWGAAVSVAPLHMARGVQNKVLEAVAAGLPCVVTQAVRAGLPDEVLSACLIEDTDQAFAAAIVRLLRMTPGQRRAMASPDFTALSWGRRLQPLLPLLHEAAASR